MPGQKEEMGKSDASRIQSSEVSHPFTLPCSALTSLVRPSQAMTQVLLRVLRQLVTRMPVPATPATVLAARMDSPATPTKARSELLMK